MQLVHGSQPQSKREAMRRVFAQWADEAAAHAAARDCIDLLNVTAQREALSAADWSQVQKLAEHLVRARRAQAVDTAREA
jgi:hypothetical protein